MTYVVDSDVFITAKNQYYSFDICPGFWKSVVHHHRDGRVFSVDRARGELLAGHPKEDLVRWVRNEVPEGFFLPVDTAEVMSAYTDIMMWVQRHPKYFDYAKAKFATGADGWLVAYARVHGATVVTNEQSAPDSKREIKLPDVCGPAQEHLRHASDAERLLRLGGRRARRREHATAVTLITSYSAPIPATQMRLARRPAWYILGPWRARS